MNNENFELENMHQQMNTLKQKLEKQEIVNDHMIRQSMKKTASTISRKYNVIMVLAILMVPYFYWVCVKSAGFSIAFWIGTSIFMLVCAGATYYNSRNLTDVNMMSSNLVEVRRKMARAKKFDVDWLFFGIPAVILWFGWFCYESYQIAGNLEPNWLMYGGIVGGIIGAICGFKMHFQTQHQYQEIIDQIEDITAEA